MRVIVAALLALVAQTALAVDAPTPPALARYAGQVVYVDFWASWCGPCAQSFPWLNQMHARYGNALTVVGVNVDTDAGAADLFLQRHPAHFDIVRDPTGALPERYNIEGMPSSVILDRDGRVLYQHSGFRSQDTAAYEAAIQKALGEVQVRQ